MVLWLNAIRLAAIAIHRNKLRAALTMLGILVGVSAVLTVSALGAGASAKLAEQIEHLGANVIFVFPQTTQPSGAHGKVGGRLTDRDATALVRESVSVSSSVPLLQTLGQVIFFDKNIATQIIGTTLPYFEMRKFRLSSGALWHPSDEVLKTKVCIVGATVADTLFGTEDPIGRTIRVVRAPCTIIGLLARRGTSAFGEDEDNRVMMPIGSFRARVRPTAPGRADFLVASATSEQTTDRAVEQATAILRDRHRILPDRDPDFAVLAQAELREKQQAIAQALATLLLSVASVSLVVGGIGIMNIMLVSVAERTREIGIRLSIGARARDILVQFLVEAIVLSLVGGLLGILLGTLAMLALARVLDWPLSPPPIAVAIAFLTSAMIGVIFGYLPARRAANLSPTDALRSE